MSADSGSEFSGTFLGVVALVALTVLVVGAILIYRDVERHDGDGMRAVLAWIVFWPVGIYLGRRARARKGTNR